MLDLRSWITRATANPVTNNVQILHRNKPQTTIKSRAIKVTEVDCYPTKVKVDSKSHGKLLYLQPLLAVLIPEVESTIRSSSCKCVMDLQQVVKSINSQIQHHQLLCPSLEPTAIPKLGNSHKQVGNACFNEMPTSTTNSIGTQYH